MIYDPEVFTLEEMSLQRCLDIATLEEYEYAIIKIMSYPEKNWINMNGCVFINREVHISDHIYCMWISPPNDVCVDMPLIFFISNITFEIVSLHYHFYRLKEKYSL